MSILRPFRATDLFQFNNMCVFPFDCGIAAEERKD